jgi:hypothetical protein
MRADDRPPNGSCWLKIDQSGKVCMYLELHSNRDIHGSWYSWIFGPLGMDMKGRSHPWILWDRYPITYGASTDTCFSSWISNGYHGVKAPLPLPSSNRLPTPPQIILAPPHLHAAAAADDKGGRSCNPPCHISWTFALLWLEDASKCYQNAAEMVMYAQILLCCCTYIVHEHIDIHGYPDSCLV